MISTFRRGRLALLVVMAAGSFIAGISAQRAGGPPAAPAEQTPVEGTGAISGVVIDGVSERPLAGAIVTLSGVVARLRGGAPEPRILTDDKGRFIFTKLPPLERYALSVTKVGYTTDNTPARPIALTDGQWITDAKLRLYRMGAISGTLTDEAGEPVVGAFVRVLSQVFVSGLPQLATGAAARTDDRGVYRVAGLPSARYLVVVPSVQSSVPADTTEMALSSLTPESIASMEANGRPFLPRGDRTLSPDGRNLLFLGNYMTPPSPASGRAVSYPITFYPSARSLRDAAIVELKQGEERSGIDLQVRPVTVVSVSGNIEAPPEAEAPGMTLRLMLPGTESLANGSEVATALVASSGRFTFLNVPSGEYVIVASRSQMEYQMNRSNLIGTSDSLPTPPANMGGSSGGGQVTSGSAGTQYNYRTSRGALTHSARVPVTVGNRDLTDVVVTLKRGVSVSGRFAYETPPVPSPSGRGPMSTPVYAEPADGNAALGMPTGRMTPNGAETTFNVDGLQAGLYTLRFLGGGRIRSITVDGKDYTYRPLDTSSGRDITDIVITITDKTTRLTGYVRDAQNQVTTHGSVILFPTERDQWTGYGFSPRRILSTPIVTNGSFNTAALPAGEYLAIAVDESQAAAWQDPRFFPAAAALATRVSIEWGGTVTVNLQLKQVPGFNKVP